MAASGPGARPAAAQMVPPRGPSAGSELGAFEPAGGCGSLRALQPGGPYGSGAFTCLFDALAIAGDPADPGIITITVVPPPDVMLVSGHVADQAGHVCGVTRSGAGTQMLTLTCPNGLQSVAASDGLQWRPTGSVTLEPGLGTVTVTYSASPVPQPDGSALLTPLTQRWYFPGWTAEITPPAGSMPALRAGWNLVGGPSDWNVKGGQPGSAALLPGLFYTFQAGDSDYEVIPADAPLLAGVGVWVYLPSPMPILGQPAGPLLYVTAPLPADHWIMIANPSLGSATVTGADVVYTYDPNTGSYEQSTTLRAGQGAWAWSTNGGTVTVSGTCLLPPC